MVVAMPPIKRKRKKYQYSGRRARPADTGSLAVFVNA
jgi:hypothetical protein